MWFGINGGKVDEGGLFCCGFSANVWVLIPWICLIFKTDIFWINWTIKVEIKTYEKSHRRPEVTFKKEIKLFKNLAPWFNGFSFLGWISFIVDLFFRPRKNYKSLYTLRPFLCYKISLCLGHLQWKFLWQMKDPQKVDIAQVTADSHLKN
jgi:hypothetical protein